MGSLVSITLYAESPEDAQRAFTAAFARIEDLNRILSDYDPQSELSRACNLDKPLGPDLLAVIGYAQRLAVRTQGAFDITVGPLTRLWRESRRTKQLPSPAEITEALSRSGYTKLSLENGRLRCAVPGMQLDAGGIAKGYAADEALAAIRKVGVTRALVAVSGDIVCGDAPPEKSGWKVHVQDQTSHDHQLRDINIRRRVPARRLWGRPLFAYHRPEKRNGFAGFPANRDYWDQRYRSGFTGDGDERRSATRESVDRRH